MTRLADTVVTHLTLSRDLLAEFNERCSAVKVRASSRDRAVSVEVDGTGTMTDLTIRSAATRLSADELADLIVNIAQTAAKAAVDQQRQLLEQLVPKLHALQRELTAQPDR